jgi:hypothetical protein
MRRATLVVLALAATAVAAAAQSSRPCPQCEAWMAAQRPFRVFGNVY